MTAITNPSPDYDTLFNDFVLLTARAASIDESQLVFPSDKRLRWKQLAYTWYTHADTIGIENFFLTLFKKILCGELPPGCYSPAALALLDAVEATLTSDTYINNVWIRTYVFRNALNLLRRLNTAHSSPCLRTLLNYPTFYLEARVLLNTRGKRANAFCIKYENTVSLLLPESVGWTRKQWSDVSFAIQALFDVHGIDSYDFKLLVDILYAVHIHKHTPSVYNVYYLEHLTPQIEKLIWPGDTDIMMAAFLYHSHRYVCKTYASDSFEYRAVFSTIKDSGFFRRMLEKVNDGVYDSTYKDLRKAIFEIALV